MFLTGFLDRNVPQSLKSKQLLYSRARISMGILLLNIIMLLFFLIGTLLFKSIPTGRVGSSPYILSGQSLFFLLLVQILRKTGRVSLTGNAYVLSSFGSVVGAYLLYHELPGDLILFLLPAIAILSFTLLGQKGGIFWTSVFLLTHLTLVIFRLRETIIERYDQLIIVMATYFIILISGFTYEYITFKLMGQLNFERNLYRDKAHIDKLTGIANRYSFDNFLDNAIVRALGTEKTFAVAYMDLNDFKPVNDKYGHNAGDIVLKEVASRIGHTIRQSDLVARLGGDEFAVIFQNQSGLEDSKSAVGHILTAIEKPMDIGEGVEVSISASIGVILYSPEIGHRDKLIERADELMYEAKRSGRKICFYE